MDKQFREDRYVNPYTDFGFKMLFGTEMNKELLISFINSLLCGKEVITDLRYLNSEHLGTSERDRRAVFDVYCENEYGEKILIEMQKAEQQFFKDRSIYYSTFPIREQGRKGEWNYELKAVYVIGILNFTFDDESSGYYHHKVQLMDVNSGKVFYDKLTFVYLEMPKFKKNENELDGMFDKWMFVLRNLSRLMERPAALQERVFEKLFETAEIAKFTKEQYEEYEESLKVYRDWKNTLDTAMKKAEKIGLEIGMAKGLEAGIAKGIEKGMAKGIEEGMAKGIEEGMAKGIEEGMAKGIEEGIEKTRLENAKKMLVKGFSVSDIADITGLSVEEINSL